LLTKVGLMYNVVTNIEFWMSFTINLLIVKLLKFKSMNNFKSILAGVDAIA
jgi:uncharacterized protein (DUF983 family)